mmetsp:Transcript_149506/g.479041  ORF Transcript_149506/g.479041 Transcript_149506/m.479041 type:complete len:191 (+) Transcript_149506:2-574(+)
MAVSARVGNQLGAGEPDKASISALAGLRLVLIWMCFPTVVLLAFTRGWGLIFTRDEKVLSLLKTLVYLMLVYSNLDAVLAYYNGVLSACGQQSISGTWAIRGYVFIGFPLAIIFAFGCGWGVVGLMLGHCIGKLCHTVPCIFATWRIDWPAEAECATARVRRISASDVALPMLAAAPAAATAGSARCGAA